MSNFEELGLTRPTLDAIQALGFETPSDIQKEAIPILLKSERDFIGLAQTGTGKTAAFGLPLMDLIDADHHAIQGLILAPTRELCVQITKQIEAFAKFKKDLSVLAVYGGADIGSQIRQLKRGVHLIVATPGRLRDLIKRKAAKLNELKYLVLDEADEMLNMGFREEIDEILETAPDEKTVWLFSATMSKDVRRISKHYMTDPQEVIVGTQNTANTDITHLFTLVRPSDRFEALKRFISTKDNVYGIVFCRTRRDTKDVADKLIYDGFTADAINGDLTQSQRDRVMEKFRTKRINLLVATDVAARGIDVDSISHIFHYNIPEDLDFYTHRSGRTGRAGNKGVSMILAHPKDKRLLKVLEKRIQMPIKFVSIPSATDVMKKRLENSFEKIKKAKPIKEVDEVLPDLEKIISHFSKEDLIRQIAYLTFEGEDKPKKFKEVKGEFDSGGGRGRGGRDRRGGRGGDRRGGGRRVRERDDRRRGGGGRDRDRNRDDRSDRETSQGARRDREDRGEGSDSRASSEFKKKANPFHKKKARKKFEKSKKKKKKKF